MDLKALFESGGATQPQPMSFPVGQPQHRLQPQQQQMEQQQRQFLQQQQQQHSSSLQQRQQQQLSWRKQEEQRLEDYVSPNATELPEFPLPNTAALDDLSRLMWERFRAHLPTEEDEKQRRDLVQRLNALISKSPDFGPVVRSLVPPCEPCAAYSLLLVNPLRLASYLVLAGFIGMVSGITASWIVGSIVLLLTVLCSLLCPSSRICGAHFDTIGCIPSGVRIMFVGLCLARERH